MRRAGTARRASTARSAWRSWANANSALSTMTATIATAERGRAADAGQRRGDPQQQRQRVRELRCQLAPSARCLTALDHVRAELGQPALRLARGEPLAAGAEVAHEQVGPLLGIDLRRRDLLGRRHDHHRRSSGPAAHRANRASHARCNPRRTCGISAATTADRCADPATDLSRTADGRRSARAYRGAMLTPKVICLSQMPTAHPSQRPLAAPAAVRAAR